MARPCLDKERGAIATRAEDLDALVGSDPEFGSSALRWVAEVARSSGNPTGRASFGEGLVRHAGRLAAERGGYLQGADDDSVVSDLLEAAAAVSRVVDEEEGWHQFGDLIVRFAEVWPGAAPLLRHTVASLATAARPARGKTLWDAWSRLRAME